MHELWRAFDPRCPARHRTTLVASAGKSAKLAISLSPSVARREPRAARATSRPSEAARNGHCTREDAMSPTDIFTPASTPARWVFDLSVMVSAICAVIFVVVFGLIVYAITKFRDKRPHDRREPPQVYGSKQVELAWAIIPLLIVLALFLASARVIAFTQQDALPSALEVNVIGHQFWWEYRYPTLGIVTANELHVPASDARHRLRTQLHLYSADTVHSFWVPKLAGKTDLVPDFPNSMWIDPETPGLYLGQCAQYCGTQHAQMLLRVYVDPPAEFAKWVEAQQQPAHLDAAVGAGRAVFERGACMNCHAIAGTAATGRFGPDLTHLMSRDTLAAGIVPNTPENLRSWIQDPNLFKPGCLMPAMGFDAADLDALTEYLTTLF
jgi:cytochrome c oxidase subunit 2